MPNVHSPALDARQRSSSLVIAALAAIGFASALTVAAQVRIPLPFTPVPITLQTFVLYTGAAWLGATRAFSGLGLYVGLALVGVPLLSGWRGGLAGFAGATGGYILGWFVAVLLLSRWLDGTRRTRGTTVLSMFAASAIILSCGALHLALLLDLGWKEAFLMGVAPFLPGDAIKVLTASAMVRRWPNPLSLR